MDIQNIADASGLSAEDRATLGDLVDVYGAVSSRNCMLDAYYEGEQETPGIGIDNIPDCVDPDVRSDWARKAVTSVSERVRMDGFTFAGDYTDGQRFEQRVQPRRRERTHARLHVRHREPRREPHRHQDA